MRNSFLGGWFTNEFIHETSYSYWTVGSLYVAQENYSSSGSACCDGFLVGMFAYDLPTVASASNWLNGSLVLHKRIILVLEVIAGTDSLMACLLVIWMLCLQARTGRLGHLCCIPRFVNIKLYFK